MCYLGHLCVFLSSLRFHYPPNRNEGCEFRFRVEGLGLRLACILRSNTSLFIEPKGLLTLSLPGSVEGQEFEAAVKTRINNFQTPCTLL